MMTNRTGIYIHIPFCERKCSYCDFYSVAGRSLEGPFFERLEAEIEESPFRGRDISTLYFGGGTPSSVPSHRIRRCLKALGDSFNLEGLEETTLELNPGTASLEKLLDYRDMGIGRLSIGVQSFDDGMLKRLARIHTSADVYATIGWAREAGFSNLSIDLMYGLPEDSLERMESDLAKAAALGVEHISVYGLILEEGTQLMREHEEGRLELPGEETLLQMRRLINRKLEAAGFKHYEIANYAREGRESRHNLIYWHNDDYLAFGPGSTGKADRMRSRTAADLKTYCRDGAPILKEEEERITPEMELEEGIFLGLRLLDGIQLEEFNSRYDIDFMEKYRVAIEELQELGAIEVRGGRLRLTESGIDISNYCMARFLS